MQPPRSTFDAATASLDQAFQFPPDLLEQLIATIPLLARSKKAVISFFKGAGAIPADTQDLEADLVRDRDSHNKYDLARTILTRLNQRGDAALAARRELIKRVVEFEDFSTCWESDRLKAMGQVAAVRKLVNVHDSFARMAQEREREAARRRETHEAQVAETKRRAAEIEDVRRRLFAMFGESDAHKRGKALEAVLNDLFAAYGILIREAFALKGDSGEGTVEQIDGVIELDGHLYLVEMKWYASAIGTSEIAQPLVRLFARDGARGLIIANPGFTEPAIKTASDALRSRVVVLATLEEIVAVLNKESDLAEMLRGKVRAAVVDRTPFAPA